MYLQMSRGATMSNKYKYVIYLRDPCMFRLTNNKRLRVR